MEPPKQSLADAIKAKQQEDPREHKRQNIRLTLRMWAEGDLPSVIRRKLKLLGVPRKDIEGYIRLAKKMAMAEVEVAKREKLARSVAWYQAFINDPNNKPQLKLYARMQMDKILGLQKKAGEEDGEDSDMKDKDVKKKNIKECTDAEIEALLSVTAGFAGFSGRGPGATPD